MAGLIDFYLKRQQEQAAPFQLATAREGALRALQQYSGLVPQQGPTRPGESLGMIQNTNPQEAFQQKLQGLTGLLSNPLTQQVGQQVLQQQLAPEQQKFSGPIQQYLEASQLGLIPEGMGFADFKKLGSTNINIGDNPGRIIPSPEARTMGLDPNETWWLDPKSGPKKLGGVTDTQRTAAGFAARMIESGRILDSIEQTAGFDPTSLAQQSDIVLGDVIGNFLKSPLGKSYSAAAKNWVRANLRKESGAVIGEDEMASEIRTYFPQPGDDKKVIQQKRNARMLAERNLAGQGGEFFKKSFSGLIPAPENPAFRIKGMVYKTPKGGLKWTGTGWVQP